MNRSLRSRKAVVIAAACSTAPLPAVGCSSSSGGKKAEEAEDTVAAGEADTPRMRIAMITHATPGDTFWDIVRKGAQAAAKDNVKPKA
jgi:simple sugar transport system substrate-binding protein